MEAIVSQFFDSIKAVKSNYKKYDTWEQQQADDVEKRRYLSKKLDLPKDKVELTRAKAKAVFNASDIMDKRSEDNCANMEQATGLLGLAVVLPLLYVNSPKADKVNPKLKLILTALPWVAALGLIFWGNAQQKESSRIGRFQAKQTDLKDAKNFVIYTPQQIDVAKKIADKAPDKSEKKDINGFFSGMKQILKDRGDYKKNVMQKAGNDEEIKRLLNKNYTPEQLAQGEEDKEAIVNIVKDVNMSAENYSENVENVFDIVAFLSAVTDIPVTIAAKKITDKFKNLPERTKLFIPAAACMIYPALIGFWATKEKKEGSRVGRFVKRQEILDNPELIMAYSDEQLKLAKDIKAPKAKKGFFNDISNNIEFFGKYLKDRKAYNEYKKTTLKNNQKLNDILMQTKVSDKQLKDAQNLQEKTFRAFDKIDEMSQRYSEDTEAATELAKIVIEMAIAFIPMGLAVALLFGLKKGALSVSGIVKTISKMAFKKDSSIRTFVESAHGVIKKDKSLKKDLLNVVLSLKAKEEEEIIKKQEAQARIFNHPELKKLFTDFMSKPEIDKSMQKLKNIQLDKPDEVIKTGVEIFKEHSKQGPVSKWFTNLSFDILKLSFSSKIKNIAPVKKAIKETGKESDIINKAISKIKEYYNNYKTLSKTILFGGGLIMLGIPVVLSLAVASLFTNIQLKAGKIGIMKAMEEIDNPKLFVND